jgi:acyl-CoA synthetase (AMP-forming)/AMP-acid ligase II
MTSLAHLVRIQAARHGDARWFAFVDSERGHLVEQERMTYRALDERAQSLGAWLAGKDMTDQVALLLYPAGLDFVAAFLGCLYARVIAVPVPLPATDPRALERAAAIIGDTGAHLILTDSATHNTLREWLHHTGLASTVDCVTIDTANRPAPARFQLPDMDAGTLAYLQYTSGSTSRPRGVMLSHGNLRDNLGQIDTVVRPPNHGVGAGWLPHYHDMGLIGLILGAIHAGCDLVLTSPVSFIGRPVLWLQMISRYRAQLTAGPNFAYEWLARSVTNDQMHGLDLSCLEWALNGAEPIRAATLHKLVRRFGPIGFAPRTWAPAYGMAEATLLVTGSLRGDGPHIGRFDPAHLERHRATPAQDGVELPASGRPVGSDVRIVDHQRRSQLPDAHVGEIWVAGASVALGYWGNDAATRETFCAHLDDGQGPFLRTGDLGFFLDGQLYVTGRLKELIVVNGRNLYPQDIEETSRTAHPAAGTAAAFAVDIGHEHLVVIQEVRKTKLNGLTYQELTTAIKQTIRNAYGIPPSVVLVRRNGVPKTTSGKIQRRRIREAFLAGELNALHTQLHPQISAHLTA